MGAVILWLIFWLVAGMPEVEMWNGWAICLAFALLWWFLD
jgi:hypothetical protein